MALALTEADFGTGPSKLVARDPVVCHRRLGEQLQFSATLDLLFKETGKAPARAVERLRGEVARLRSEDSREPIELVAWDVGYGDAERMRRSFLRLSGQSPQAARRIARACSYPSA